MREIAVSLMTGDGSSKAETHSLFREATNSAGKKWKWVFMLASRNASRLVVAAERNQMSSNIRKCRYVDIRLKNTSKLRKDFKYNST